MGTLAVSKYFPSDRMVIEGQQVSEEAGEAIIRARPDKRFTPICYECGERAEGIQSWHERRIRDLDLASAEVEIECEYRTIRCGNCEGYHVEDLQFFDRYKRITNRLARSIYQFCQELSVQKVADHYGLSWRTVKEVDKAFLSEEYGEGDYDDLRILAVDEIALRKGHNYMTVVLNYETGEVLWMGKDRKAATLKEFFGELTDEQQQTIEAIAMDMWDPYIKAVREEMPHVNIVFDLYHMVQAFNKVIDQVRNAEKREAEQEQKEVIKGTKYLLYKNPENRKKKRRRRLSSCVI